MTLNKTGLALVLRQLARRNGHVKDTWTEGRVSNLFAKLASSWGHRPDRQRVTVKVGEQDLAILKGLGLRPGILEIGMLPSSGWQAIYRHPKSKQLEVRVTQKTRPPKKRTFIIGGKRRRLVAVKYTRLGNTNSQKEAVKMATKTRKKAKPVEDDELDELEGLEEIDDLEDLEDEEPDDEDEDEDDDEDEDEEPAPKRKGRAATKKSTTKAKKSTSRRKAVDEDEDEDEEDEDEPPARKRGSTKAKGKAASSTKGKAATKGAKTAAKSSSKKGNGNLPATRELPKGQVGPADIAEMVGGDCDARYVRIYLRENYERQEGGRWAFSKKDAQGIAKDIKRHRKEVGAG